MLCTFNPICSIIVNGEEKKNSLLSSCSLKSSKEKSSPTLFPLLPLPSFTVDDDRVVCCNCHQSFNNARVLNEHNNAVHKHFHYECNICNNVFLTNAILQVHKQDSHVPPPPPLAQQQQDQGQPQGNIIIFLFEFSFHFFFHLHE